MTLTNLSDLLRHKLPLVFAALALLFVFLAIQPVSATTLPPNFSENVVMHGLNQPMAMEFAPDGRLFYLEQQGSVRIIENGQLLPAPFVTVSANAWGDRGLLGLAFDPNFAENGYLYLFYTTADQPFRSRISRFTAEGNRAVADSELILTELEPASSATNHNGGVMNFGPDGMLYIATGDNSTSNNGQLLSNRFGKILRINPNGSIPEDNPFYTQTEGGNRAIWAYGLRHPFTFAFQPSTGRMFINDVGENRWEEINEGIAGANYGWPLSEGPTTDPRFVTPLYAYEQQGNPQESGCAITGGVFYNPLTTQFPAEWQGDYFFADHCSNWIRRFDPETGITSAFVTDTWTGPVDLDVASDGTLYYLARGTRSNEGRILSISYTSSITPTPSATTTETLDPLLTPTDVTPVGTPDATQTAFAEICLTQPPVAETPTPTATLIETITSTPTLTPSPTATLNPDAPTPVIMTPVVGATYNAGDTLVYEGSASDLQDGILPPESLEWEIVFHHDVHTHPFMPATRGASGSISIPTQGEVEANVWYRVYLRAYDSAGQFNETFVDVHPNISTLNIQTEPTGLQIKLDGQPVITPLTVNSVVGVLRTLDVEPVQMLDGVEYVFSHWSNGGETMQTISTSPENTTYVAVFVANSSATPTEDVTTTLESTLPPDGTPTLEATIEAGTGGNANAVQSVTEEGRVVEITIGDGVSDEELGSVLEQPSLCTVITVNGQVTSIRCVLPQG